MYKTKTFYLFILFPIITSLPCGFSSFFQGKNRTIKTINETHTTPTKENNLRQTSSKDYYHPIQFVIDYSNFVAYSNTTSQEYQEHMKQAITKTTELFSELLLLPPNRYQALRIQLRECDETLPNNGTIITTADIVLIPVILPQSKLGENVLAAAGACLITTDATKRPIAGMLLLGEGYDFSNDNADEYLHMLLLHEITHVLVFDNSLFPYYYTNKQVYKEVNLRGEKKNIIVTPKVKEQARRHFGCDSLEGVEIESQGGAGSAGSHWEARTMLGDYMISTDYDDVVISDITLALFEDSGWYKANYYTGGLFRFGKDQGCDFIKEKCVINGYTKFTDDFCTSSWDEGCSSGHLSKGICYLGEYSGNLPKQFQYYSKENVGGFGPADYCPVNYGMYNGKKDGYLPFNCKTGMIRYENLGETIGDHSMCVEVKGSSSSIAVCYEMKCFSDKYGNRIEIKIQDNVVVCKQGQKEQIVEGLGKVMCPDFKRVCSGTVWCNEPTECIKYKSLTANITDIIPEPEPQPNPQPEPENSDPTFDVSIKPNPQPQPQPEPQPDPQPQPEPEPEPENSDPALDVSIKPNPQNPQPEPDQELEQDPEQKPQSDPEPEPDPEQKPETDDDSIEEDEFKPNENNENNTFELYFNESELNDTLNKNISITSNKDFYIHSIQNILLLLFIL